MLATAAGTCDPMEQCIEEAKGEVSLDQYEARHFHRWYRHYSDCDEGALRIMHVIRE